MAMNLIKMAQLFVAVLVAVFVVFYLAGLVVS